MKRSIPNRLKFNLVMLWIIWIFCWIWVVGGLGAIKLAHADPFRTGIKVFIAFCMAILLTAVNLHLKRGRRWAWYTAIGYHIFTIGKIVIRLIWPEILLNSYWVPSITLILLLSSLVLLCTRPVREFASNP